MKFNFNDKIALITGGTSGIGLATAKMLAESGSSVIITGRNSAKGNVALAEIKKYPVKSDFLKMDISDPMQIEKLFEYIAKQYGRLDIAFNNAGILGPVNLPLAEYSLKNYHEVMNINTTSVFLCMKYELQFMTKRNQGVIVNMSSIAGIKAGKAGPIYTASKHAIIGLTRSAAVQYAKNNIRINAICPGLIKTDMVSELNHDETLKLIPMQRFGKSNEVANTVLWLCSDYASFITGSYYVVDGGITA